MRPKWADKDRLRIKVAVLANFLQAARRSASQAARRPASTSWTTRFRHLGVLGLFLLAIIDSSPVPTFAGTDILTAILAASHRSPWWEYAAVATAGSVLGAWLTYRVARRVGIAYMDSKFGHARVIGLLNFFKKHGAAALAVSCAVPLPFPTSAFFGAAGAAGYRVRRFLTIVVPSRAARYTLIAILADHYGRRFVRAVRHPDQYWGWLLFFVVIIVAVFAAVILISKRLQMASETETPPA